MFLVFPFGESTIHEDISSARFDLVVVQWMNLVGFLVIVAFSHFLPRILDLVFQLYRDLLRSPARETGRYFLAMLSDIYHALLCFRLAPILNRQEDLNFISILSTLALRKVLASRRFRVEIDFFAYPHPHQTVGSTDTRRCPLRG